MKFLILVSALIVFQPSDRLYAQEGQSPSGTNGQQDPCPPFHRETRDVLKYFISGKHLSGRTAPQKRKEWGLDKISMQSVSHLTKASDRQACRRIKEHFPWPRDAYYRGYFKSEKYYIVVDVVIQEPAAEGMINLSTGFDLITIVDKDYNLIGTVLL